MVRVMTVLGVLLAIAGGQTQRWVYRHDGPASSGDGAFSLVCGVDSNVYAAGYSTGSGTDRDFTVISLTGLGSERWVYRYNGPGNGVDEVNSVVAGADSNIYAAGEIYDSVTLWDFSIISLTPMGSERWIYRYNGPGNDWDRAYSLVLGADGNLYAAGRSPGSGTDWDFTVISLTSSGSERWVYRYNGPGNGWDWASSLVAGADGNIYAAGVSTGSGTDLDFTVISLTSSGVERWVYRYNGPGNIDDEALSLVCGVDSNVYAAGYSAGSGTDWDFTVIGLTSSGSERWVYRYNGPGDSTDYANSLVAPRDGNIYAAGGSYGSGTSSDFTAISLTSSGNERWVYRYNGPVDGNDYAYSLVAGADGNLYAAGYSRGVTSGDFVVTSLNPVPGIAEGNSQQADNAFGLAVGTIRNRTLAYTLKLLGPATVSLSLCDLQGRKLCSWQVPARKGTSQHTRDLRDLSAGIYFLNAEVPGKGLGASRRLVVTR